MSPFLIISILPVCVCHLLVPTPESLSCVEFQYGIANNGGFSADDIFNEVNNTMKTGLILATRNVTIATLNATFPRDGSGRLLQQTLEQNSQRNHLSPESSNRMSAFLALRPYETQRRHYWMSESTSRMLQVTDLGRSRLYQDNFVFEETLPMKMQYESPHVRRRAAYLPGAFSSNKDFQSGQRRLVFYSDQFVPAINSIFDNPFCENLEEFQCAVVDTTVCVVLEEGDDEQQVQTALLDGIQQSILDGSFQDAIPPEHQLPGDEEISQSI